MTAIPTHLMAAAAKAKTDKQLDELLGQTVPRPRSVRPPSRAPLKPLSATFKEWASSQVAAYRIGLVLGYLSIIYFGVSAFIAGIPVFQYTTPEGWTPIWASAVIAGGFIAGIGSLRAGSEPVTKEVKVYNAIELTGAILLFITLSVYAAVLLVIGYGFGDAGRASVGAGFVALGIPATVRVAWLIFRPRFLHINSHLHLVKTGSMIVVPSGYALVKLDDDGKIIPETTEQTSARLGLEGK